jgi:diadenosine tetraphosphate (Ap4A) HIT family hydrolase
LPIVEPTAVWEMVSEVPMDLIARFGVDAFDIGVNDVLAVGQTVHIHIIPRRPVTSRIPRRGALDYCRESRELETADAGATPL